MLDLQTAYHQASVFDVAPHKNIYTAQAIHPVLTPEQPHIHQICKKGSFNLLLALEKPCVIVIMEFFLL